MRQSETLDILEILWERRKIILGSMVAAFVVSCSILLMLPNYYQATAVFYPIGETMQRPIVNPASDRMALYGNDSDVDRLLSIAKSSTTQQKLIEKLDLYRYYDLDPSQRKDRIKMIKKLKKHYKVLKTKYDAISISFEDRDPEKAALSANTAMNIVNENAINMAANTRKKLQQSMQISVSDKQKLLDQITNQIDSLKAKYNIYDVDRQAEALAMIEAKAPSASLTKKAISNYTKGVSGIKSLEVQQEQVAEDLAKETTVLSQLKSQSTSEQQAIHVIERASVPDIKSRPSRSLLAIASTLIMGLFVSLLIVSVDSLQRRYG